MSRVVQDARFALRLLRKRWGITLIAVASLATAIGGNTAVFSLVNGVILRPTSVVDPGRVVLVQERATSQPQGFNNFTTSLGTFADLRESIRTTAGWAALRVGTRGLRGNDRAEPIPVSEVTPGFFSVIGAPPPHGRGFRDDEAIEGASAVAIVAAEFWQQRFGDEDPLGRTLTLDGVPHEIVGVLPKDFNVLFSPANVWLPLTDDPRVQPRTLRNVVSLARLAPDGTVEALAAEVAVVATQIAEQYPAVSGEWTLDAANYRDNVPNTQTKIFYGLLQGSVFFVLLIACANITNLLLARAQERRKEIAVRLSLGAGRWRIARQLLTESALLVAAGLAAGVALGWLGNRLIVDRLAAVLPGGFDIDLDATVLLFTVVVSCLTGLVFGVAPALQTFRSSYIDAVKEGGAHSSATRGRKLLSRSLVVMEIALSLLALGGGATLIRTFIDLRNGDPGFDPVPIITAQVRVPPAKHPDDEQSALLLERILAAIDDLDGAETTAAVNVLPRGFVAPTDTFRLRGRTPEDPSRAPQAFTLVATPGYIDTFGIDLLHGRFFESHDRIGQAPVAVVNRSFADAWFPNETPVGHHIEIGDRSREIVGVVDDVMQVMIQTPGGVQSEAVYTPMAQEPALSYRLTARVRGGDPRLLAEPLAAALLGIEPDLAISQVLTMNEVTERAFAGIDIFNSILGGFGILAIVLASIGSYGVLAYSVTQRRREIGIRLALGAQGSGVVWMVARQGVLLAATGLALGGLFLVPLTGMIRSLMVGIAPVRGDTALGVAAILFTVTVVASLVPALRAARIDPVGALQQD